MALPLVAQEALVQVEGPVAALAPELPVRPYLGADGLVGVDALLGELLVAVVALLGGAVVLDVARDLPRGEELVPATVGARGEGLRGVAGLGHLLFRGALLDLLAFAEAYVFCLW